MRTLAWDIIVTERCSIGGFPLEEACEHCYLIQSAISVAISYIISVYCEDYAGYFTVILSFLAFRFCSAYFIYLVSCRNSGSLIPEIRKPERPNLRFSRLFYSHDPSLETWGQLQDTRRYPVFQRICGQCSTVSQKF
jgi:hypothetical protein